MSAPAKIPLSSLPRGELEALAGRLLAENAALKQAVAELRAEVATLKGVKGRPEVRPSGMEKGASSEPGAANRGRGGRGKADRLAVDEERVGEADVPAGSRFKGYEDFLVQDLVLRPHVVRVRRERWLTPDGRTVTAPMPAGVVGHFGPALRRFVLAQYHQGQVTVPRLVAQLRAIGILISKRQVVRLLNAGQDAFLAEAREVLRAGLATAGWVSVDDTGARHEHRNAVCTQLGNDHFAAFATTGSKSRLNFLEVLRAGFTDYVVNAEALAYMRQRALAGPVIARLAAHPERQFPDEAAWMRHLERLGIAALTVTPDPVRIATEGAVWGSIKAHGLLPDTVILSDDAGQFALDRHALCWVHAERLVHKLDTFTDRQHAAQQLVRALIWFSNRAPSVNPSSRSPHPSLARHHPTDPVSGPAIVLSRFEGACAGPMVLSAVGTRPPHDGSSSESAFQCGSRGPRAAATKSTEWPHPRPGRDPSTRPKDGREPMSGSGRAGPPTYVPMTSGRRVRRRIEGRSRLQHRVHDHRQLARDRDRGPLEADLLLQLEAPAPQRAVRAGAGQDRGRRLVDQRPEVPVASPRDVAVVVGLARLVPACRQAEPSPHRARRPEVLRRLDRRHERGRRDGPDAGDRHEPPAGRARPRRGDQLPVELGRPGAHRAPRLEQRQHDPGHRLVPPEQGPGPGPGVGLEDPAGALRHDQAEGPHDAADLVGELDRDAEQLAARAHQRSRQHRRVSLDPDLPVEADLRDLRQAVGVVRVGLVRRHVERRLRVPRVDAHHRQGLGLELVVEPGRQRPGLEHDAGRVRRTLADDVRH